MNLRIASFPPSEATSEFIFAIIAPMFGYASRDKLRPKPSVVHENWQCEDREGQWLNDDERIQNEIAAFGMLVDDYAAITSQPEGEDGYILRVLLNDKVWLRDEWDLRLREETLRATEDWIRRRGRDIASFRVRIAQFKPMAKPTSVIIAVYLRA